MNCQNIVAVSTIGVQYDSGKLGLWVYPNGAHWIDILFWYDCVNAIFIWHSQYCITIWQQSLYCMYHLIANLKKKAISKQFFTVEYVT